MVSENRLLVSYFTLRKLIGWMAILLPFVLALLNWIFFREGLGTSVSSYYHTRVGDLFVGALCAIGVFLLAYKGYQRLPTDKPHEISDNIVGNLAGVFAIGVALFPTAPQNASKLDDIIGIIHFVFAALFLASLAYFALFLFTKTHPATVTHPNMNEELRKAHLRKKKQRNRVYRVSSGIIALCIVLIGVNAGIGIGVNAGIGAGIGDAYQAIKPVFWLEAIAVVAFGFSWLVKGQALLRDPT